MAHNHQQWHHPPSHASGGGRRGAMAGAGELTPEHTQQFAAQGWTVIRNLIPVGEFQPYIDAFDSTLASCYGTPGQKEQQPEPPGRASRRRGCHSAAPPTSPFSRCFNRDGEGCQQNDSLADG